ncbi:GntR family transcriptional regulator [Lentilactobacillus farraginis]|uniref:Transcriptional regulator, GntR family n=2 Tax=Lentilactobacillus farraginis DSM 18382 = JCM 14108 TaxID=1423743 RepID=X0QFU8_9LACO|nr:GntR family transcriptional regulator [Lentilactobacillus farraginis]GAF37460.1 transcriptional regulator, GntR family [Lentilactobacillus farraginis DSM 18382 = JCM 14108]
MKFDDKIPIYYQIKEYIYRQMITGKLEPGEKMPAVRQLAVDLTVNVNTIQRALSELVTEKMVESKRGRGNFVTEDTSKIKELKDKLIMEQLKQMYDGLQKLGVSDQEILDYVSRYVKEQERDQK